MGFLSGLLSVAAPIAGAALAGPLGASMGAVAGNKLAAGIGAGVQAAGNAFGAAENYKHQQELLKQQIEAQQQLQKDQNDWNEQMWNKQNEYNTPANQRQLYEEAGLNPAYFLGEGKSTAGSVGANTISVPSVPTPAGNFQALGSLGDVASLALIDSQIRKNNSDAGLSEAEQKTLDQVRESEVKYKKALADRTEEEIKQVQATVDKIKADEAYVKALKVLTETQKKQLDEILKWMPLLNQKQLDEIDARIDLYKSEKHLNEVQAALLPVFALAAKLSAEAAKEQARASNKMADAAMMNAETNRAIAPSVIKRNNAGARLDNANAEGQEIENYIKDETKGARIYKENAEGYVGTTLNLMDGAWNFGTKVASDILSGGITAVLRNGGFPSSSNPVSNRDFHESGSVELSDFVRGFKKKYRRH